MAKRKFPMLKTANSDVLMSSLFSRSFILSLVYNSFCSTWFIQGVYGDVTRVKIMFNKKDTALVQFSDPGQAQIGNTYIRCMLCTNFLCFVFWSVVAINSLFCVNDYISWSRLNVDACAETAFLDSFISHLELRLLFPYAIQCYISYLCNGIYWAATRWQNGVVSSLELWYNQYPDPSRILAPI
jgi:RNA recognition motif. (a.k.a. RRM, RBD, or RNP domain)